MQKMISPFTRTPGVAGKAFIETHFSEEIIANFESHASYKYVYKIVGLRGSGKSVEYARVMEHFRQKKNWLVYALSAGGNPLNTLIALLSREAFIDGQQHSTSLRTAGSLGGNAAIFSANLSTEKMISSTDNAHYYSEEAIFREMLSKAKENGYRILIGVDDIARSAEMVKFLSILGAVLMEKDTDVRFICTGLSKNIEDFVSLPHLSFFVRNESIVMKPLDLHAIVHQYRELLHATREQAVALARFTEGYAYAYQVLGELCFKADKNEIDEKMENDFDDAMAPQYDLIWSTLTEAEQELVKIIVNSDSGAIKEIKEKMQKPAGFASLRDRLLKKHLLVSEARGVLSVPLPRFKEYVEIWQ